MGVSNSHTVTEKKEFAFAATSVNVLIFAQPNVNRLQFTGHFGSTHHRLR